MGEKYKERWFDFLPWILLEKRVAYQQDLGTSPSMLAFGCNPAVPGDLLRDPGDPLSKPELEELVKFMGHTDDKPPKPTGIQPQTPVPEPPPTVTHVYTRQHNTTGLQAPYQGPFPVISRPSRSTVKIRVGYSKHNVPRYEIRHWRDLNKCPWGPPGTIPVPASKTITERSSSGRGDFTRTCQDSLERREEREVLVRRERRDNPP